MRARPTARWMLVAGTLLFAASCSDSDLIINSTPNVVRGNGLVVEESRSVSGFDRLRLGGVGHVYIRQTGFESLRVRAEENLIQHLKTDVRGGELTIWKDVPTLMTTRPIEYHLTVNDLSRIALTGAGQIDATNLSAGNLELRLSGAGNIEIVHLDATNLDVDASGVGDVILTGSVDRQTISLRSMARYNGRDLDSSVADVVIESIGSATVRVRDHLIALINGGGSVYYLGDPVVDSTVNGSGEVVRIGG